jgi:phosphate transport system permease protein
MAIVNQPYPPGSQSGAAEGATAGVTGPLRSSAARAAATQPATTLARATSPQRALPERRPLVQVHAVDVMALAGAAGGALATTAILWTQLSSFTGIIGYVVVSWCLFVLYYAALVAFDQKRTAVRDRVAAVVVHSLASLVLLALALVVFYTFVRAWKALVHVNFYTQDLHSTTPLDPLTKGGVLHAMVGTLIEVTIAMAIAVPLGLLTALFLHEVPGKLSRLVRTVVDAMTALPDILAGLFIFATLILIFGLGLCGLAAGCALAVTTVAIVCRAAYVVLRLVPGGLTEASYALGSGHARTVWHVTLPTARSGLATAVILGTARAIGETSPVLLTAGATGYLNFNPTSGPMMSLPLEAYTLVSNPEPNYIARGFGAAAVLLVLVVLLFVIMRVVGGRGAGQLTGGQLRRRLAASGRDLTRISSAVAARAAVAARGGYGPSADARGADRPSRWFPGVWLPGRRP